MASHKASLHRSYDISNLVIHRGVCIEAFCDCRVNGSDHIDLSADLDVVVGVEAVAAIWSAGVCMDSVRFTAMCINSIAVLARGRCQNSIAVFALGICPNSLAAVASGRYINSLAVVASSICMNSIAIVIGS